MILDLQIFGNLLMRVMVRRKNCGALNYCTLRMMLLYVICQQIPSIISIGAISAFIRLLIGVSSCMISHVAK